MQLYMGQYSSYSTPDGWESASMSDDDEDGEWVDVHHSSDEDTGEIVSCSDRGGPSCYMSDTFTRFMDALVFCRCLGQAEKLQSIPEEERKAKAAAISSSRLLTQDDFKKIRLAQMAKEVNAAPGKGQKRKVVDLDDEDDNRLENYMNHQWYYIIFYNLSSLLVKTLHSPDSRFLLIKVGRTCCIYVFLVFFFLIILEGSC